MKILVSTDIAELVARRLPDGVSMVRIDSEGHLDGDAADAVAFFRWWSSRTALEHIFELAPSLRWLHTPSAGVNQLLVPALWQRNIVLTNGAGMHAIPIAEFVMAFMLNHAKGMAALNAAQAERHWARPYEARELYGASLLIVGIGGIGGVIAERAATFGMRIFGSRRTPRPLPGVERVVGEGAWRELLPEAEYVVIAVPLTPATRHMFGAAEFAVMRPDAYLINIARGEIIDDDALVEAMRARRIAGAALDAFATEPLPPDSPLWDLPGVTITPHATAHSPRLLERAVDLFLDNLTRFIAGQPLRNVVDKEAGY